MTESHRARQATRQLPLATDNFACPECATDHNKVIDTRQTGTRRRRRRLCANGHRFTTYELAADELHQVEQQLAEFREWRSQMRDLLRGAA